MSVCSTLMRPCTQGGLAFPDCHKHLLAAQLVTVALWLNTDLFNSSEILEAAVIGSLEVLTFLVYRGPRTPYEPTPSMITTLRAWRVGLACEG